MGKKIYLNLYLMDFLVAQLVKNLAAMQGTLIPSLSQQDLLEKGKATYSSIQGLPCWLSW